MRPPAGRFDFVAELILLSLDMKPAFVGLVEGGKFVPAYAKVVSSTPQDVLDKATAAR